MLVIKISHHAQAKQVRQSELLNAGIWMVGWVSRLHRLVRGVDSLQLLLWGTGAASGISNVWTPEQNHIYFSWHPTVTGLSLCYTPGRDACIPVPTDVVWPISWLLVPIWDSQLGHPREDLKPCMAHQEPTHTFAPPRHACHITSRILSWFCLTFTALNILKRMGSTARECIWIPHIGGPAVWMPSFFIRLG